MKLLLKVLIALILIPSAYAEEIKLDFYDQKLVFPYDPDFWHLKKIANNDEGVKKLQRDLIKSNYDTLIRSLLKCNSEIHINDWLYFKLLKDLCFKYSSKNNFSKHLWFLIGQSGYKTILGYSKYNTYVFIYSSDQIFDIPKQGEKFCLNCDSKLEEVELSNYDPYKLGKYAELYFSELPKLSNNHFLRKIYSVPSIESINPHLFSVEVDKNLLSIYREYPNVNMEMLSKAPLSNTIQYFFNNVNSFLKPYNDSIKVSYMMHIIASVSEYKTDQEIYGKKDKWMFPEEFFYYRSG